MGTNKATAAEAQWVKALAPQAEGWVLKSQARHTSVGKQVVTAPLLSDRQKM